MTAFRTTQIIEEACSVCYLALIAALAATFNFPLLFFPELAALAYEVMRNPGGKWARSPFFLALTPPLTGVVGVCIGNAFPYGPHRLICYRFQKTLIHRSSRKRQQSRHLTAAATQQHPQPIPMVVQPTHPSHYPAALRHR